MKDRRCEVCGHEWKTRYAPDWILVCPKCGISGYHAPVPNRAAPEEKPAETPTVREKLLELALRAADNELCDLAFRIPDYAIPYQLRAAINDALAGIASREPSTNLQKAVVPAETPRDNAETEKELEHDRQSCPTP